MNSADLQQLEAVIKKALVNVVTKDDAKNFTNKDDLKAFATKDDLENMQDSIIQEMDSLISDYIQILDQRKADKSDVMKLADRVTRVEEKIAA